MRQLSKIKDVLGRVIPNVLHESLLVFDATVKRLATSRTLLAAAAIDGIVLAKLDGTARGGVAYPFVNTPVSPSNLLGPVSDQKTLRCSTPSHMSTRCSPRRRLNRVIHSGQSRACVSNGLPPYAQDGKNKKHQLSIPREVVGGVEHGTIRVDLLGIQCPTADENGQRQQDHLKVPIEPTECPAIVTSS